MMPGLNLSKKDPKFILLGKVFKNIDGKKFQKTLSRTGIKNIKNMTICIKIVFASMFFDYDISKLIDELNRENRLKKFFSIDGEVPNAVKVYETLSRYSIEQIEQIFNSIVNMYKKRNKRNSKVILIDATSVSVDIKHIQKHVAPERLKKLSLKWGYSKNKGHYIGFKVTVALDKDTLLPLAIKIHPGSPNDKKILPEILEELKRRRKLKEKTIILADKGYFSYDIYQIGMNIYKVALIVFPVKTFDINKLNDQLSYPLEVYKPGKKNKKLKITLNKIKTILLNKLENWKELKPTRGIIEDFFKVCKDAFGLDKLHKYTTKSVSKHIILCILLTTMVIKTGFTTKSDLQKLSEGNIELKPTKKTKKKTKKDKNKEKKKASVPKELENPTLDIILKDPQTKLEKYLNI